MRFSLKGVLLFLAVLFIAVFVFCYNAVAQSLGNTGTITGIVTDPSGAVIPGATVRITNPVSGYTQETRTGDDGTFRLPNLPPNPYHLTVTSGSFASFAQDVDIRNAVPVQVNAKLGLKGSETVVEVAAGKEDLLEVDPTQHVDTDHATLDKLPVMDPGASLSNAITYTTGGVAADANGFFHPLGDHAQASFVIDNQPISDQQSKVFSTQLPTSAIQSMEIDTGAVNAEFGDKTSLVAQVTTKSGLGSHRLFGNLTSTYGTFGTSTADVGLGYGNDKLGDFIAVDGVRSGRFLDTPEFLPIHDIGNSETIFNRFDYQANTNNVFHLNLFGARNWIQIPNTFDQLCGTTNGAGNCVPQDQRQRVLTWSIAPGYQHIFSTSTLLSVNPYVREDQFNYYPSADLFADTPATQAQDRHLFNYGVKSDLSINKGRHSLKFGIDLKQTRLLENFRFGITDPTFNAPCNDPAEALPCTVSGDNSGFSPGLAPFDLSRGGTLFSFHGTHNINQDGFYGQDSIKVGNFLFNMGLRGDFYHGLVSKSEPEPRAGIAYNIKRTGTVLRVAYSRTMETPFNENLLLSSSTGVGGLTQNVFGASGVVQVPSGFRNQFNVGLQQAFGKWLVVDADYFWKYTHNAFDFSTLLDTTITFPIAWHNSKLDGVTGRVSTTNIKGFQAYYTFGHNRARYFPPEVGGLISIQPPSVFRIDHDQAFQHTLNARYQRPRNAEYIDFVWRYDSGLVVSGVPDVAAALALTPNQQVDIGLACNGVPATLANPFDPNTPCAMGTSTLLTLPQTGTENDDHNPDRVKPRSLLDLGIGTENLFHSEGKKRWVASIQVMNLTNKLALYNFLSTFSGTHFVPPRTITARLGFTF